MTIGDWPPRRAARGAWLCLAFAAACGGSGDSDRPKGEDHETREHRTGDSPPGADAPDPKITVAANDAMSPAPFDATPSPDGKQVYYTALSSSDDGEPAPAVFAVAASGGR